MKKLDKEQAIVLTGYTGCICCDVQDFYADLEARAKSVNIDIQNLSLHEHERIADLYRDDFLKMVDGE